MANFLDSLRTIFKLSGSQAFPTNENRIVLTNSEKSGYYTAPCDGYFGVYNNNSNIVFCDLYSTITETLGGRITSFNYSSGSTASGTIPVKKGNIVRWQSDTAITEMWFVPSIGSD